MTAMTAEAPGGTVGCDVCGLLLDEDRASAHRAWHRAEEERFQDLLRMIQELLDLLGADRSEPRSVPASTNADQPREPA